MSAGLSRAKPGRDPVLILGAGIAGLGAARGLSSRGHEIVVIDAASEVGGTHRSRVIGPYTFDVGSIFYEDDALVFRIFPGLRDLCPVVRRVERRLTPEAGLVDFPLGAADLAAPGRLHRVAAQLSLGWSKLTRHGDGSLEGACVARLGRHFYEDSGLKSYLERINHVPPAEVDQEFYAHRLGFLQGCPRQPAMPGAFWPRRHRPGPRSLRVRPSEGFEALLDPARRMLDAAGVRIELGAEIRRIRKIGDLFEVETASRSFRGCAVVNAMPLAACHKAVFGTESGLQSLDLMTLFVSAKRLPAAMGNVVQNFHPQGRWNRATIYSRIYPGLGAGREFLSVEVTLPPDTPPDPAAAYDDFARHVCGLGLEIEGLRLEGHDLVPQAYPFTPLGQAQAAAPVLEALEAFGIVSVGRQGRFEYLPTATGVLRRVNEELALASARLQLRSSNPPRAVQA